MKPKLQGNFSFHRISLSIILSWQRWTTDKPSEIVVCGLWFFSGERDDLTRQVDTQRNANTRKFLYSISMLSFFSLPSLLNNQSFVRNEEFETNPVHLFSFGGFETSLLSPGESEARVVHFRRIWDKPSFAFLYLLKLCMFSTGMSWRVRGRPVSLSRFASAYFDWIDSRKMGCFGISRVRQCSSQFLLLNQLVVDLFGPNYVYRISSVQWLCCLG